MEAIAITLLEHSGPVWLLVFWLLWERYQYVRRMDKWAEVLSDLRHAIDTLTTAVK